MLDNERTYEVTHFRKSLCDQQNQLSLNLLVYYVHVSKTRRQLMCCLHVTIYRIKKVTQICCAAEMYLVDLNAESPQYDESCLHKPTLKTLAPNIV